MKTPDRASTRDRLIEAARDLFHRKGYAGTGLADLLRHAKARSGSLYYFFKSKEDVLLAVLDRYTEMLWPEVMTPAFARTSDPIERIFAVLALYREGLVETGCAQGCPIGNLALEVGDAMPAAREKIVRNFDGWCAAIRRCLDEARDRLPAGVDREQLARFVLTVLEGGVMQARASRRVERFDEAVAQLQHYFDCLLAQSDKKDRKKSMVSGKKGRPSRA